LQGGITQKLSAFSVNLKDKNREVIFLDTPGHAAFTAMRSYGAKATDVVVLVVALDDGVRPQTREAAKIAKAMGCTLVVAVNKMDKITDPDERDQARLNLLTELTGCDVVAEEFGGDIQVVGISGKTGMGIPDLLDSILLQVGSVILTLRPPPRPLLVFYPNNS
jgi:translation initiation factor IF-2